MVLFSNWHNSYNKISIVLILNLILLCQNLTFAGQHERRLLKKLFKDYDPLERPVENESHTLEVKVGMAIQQVVDLDEKMQVLRSSGWMDYGWNDYSLKWDPAEFGNITVLRVSATRIWTPDVLLYNTADDSFDSGFKANAIIQYTGDIKYLPPVLLKSTCEIAIQNFPFDEQKCWLKFGSWTYDESKINLTPMYDAAQLDTYIPNGEWDLVSVYSTPFVQKYDCCVEKYPFVLFTLHLRRRTLYFIFNLVFPCVLISFMTVLGFALPPDSGEKIALEITTLLSIIMFLQLITGIIPESSQAVPTIGIYFASVILICAISVISNVIVLIFHHRNVKYHVMPPWIKKWICYRLARLLGMRIPNIPSPDDASLNNTINKYPMAKHDISESSSKSLLANVFDEKTNDFVLNDDFGVLHGNTLPRLPVSYNNHLANKTSSYYQPIGGNAVATSGGSTDYLNQRIPGFNLKAKNMNQMHTNKTSYVNNDIVVVKKEIHQILEEIRCITRKIKEDDEDSNKELDWKFAAMVLDKLCLYVFGILTITSTSAILLSSPNFFKLK